MEQEIKSMLDQLSELKSQIDVMRIQKDELISTVITPEIKNKLAEIDQEFDSAINRAEDHANALTEAIKNMTLTHGATVRGQYNMAVFAKGRVSWDTKQLDGMAKLIPALLDARIVGNPSISIRSI